MAVKNEVPGLGGTWANLFFMFAAIAVGGGLLVVALNALGLTHISLSAVSGGGAGPQVPPSSGAGGGQLPNCGNQLPIAQMVTYYNDPNNNNQYTKVATQGLVYIAGSPTGLANVTTSTGTTANTTPSAALSCGSKVREIAGDAGVTYYWASTTDFVVDNSVLYPPNGGLGLKMIPSGASTVYVKSATSLYASTLTFNWTAAGQGNGTTDSSDIMVKVQAPASPNVFGDLGDALCFRYSSANFTLVSAIGGTAVSMAHVKATATLDTVSCYEFPTLALGGYREVTLNLKGASAGPSNGTTIDMYDVDKTNELYNGYLVPNENAKAGVTSNGYDLINTPNTGTGRADVNTNSFITITR